MEQTVESELQALMALEPVLYERAKCATISPEEIEARKKAYAETRQRAPKQTVSWEVRRKLIERITKMSIARGDKYTILTRGMTKDAAELTKLDMQFMSANHPNHIIEIPHGLRCYGCGKHTTKFHNNYIYSCPNCGTMNQELRHILGNLTGYVALITGGRTKLGYQCALKMLRSGAIVIATTRHPEQAMETYNKEPDSAEWIDRIHLYKLDFNRAAIEIENSIVHLKQMIIDKFGRLNILINCAAQTIRNLSTERVENGPTNRYGNNAHMPQNVTNSWLMTVCNVPAEEVEDVSRVNMISPLLMCKHFVPMLLESSSKTKRGYIVNVHAREGIFGVRKSPYHPHTNMAKAALHQLTATLSYAIPRGRVRVHGCDPGFISLNEYYAESAPWPVTSPLDEVDGAARIMYPIFMDLKSDYRTRRHFTQLIV